MTDEFDYLFLEDLLTCRIKEQLSELQFVGGLPDLSALDGQPQYSPAVYVIYLGDGISTSPAARGSGRSAQKVTQYWATVLALNTADPTDSGEQARRIAGPYLGKVISALTGWQPAQDVETLARASRQAPVHYANGYFYYPLVFTTAFMFPRRVLQWQPKN